MDIIGCKTDNKKLHISHLLYVVGNNGCGPDDWRSLVADIQEAHKVAKEKSSPEVLCYAGLYDILVNPNGSFQLIPNEGRETYRLIGEEELLKL